MDRKISGDSGPTSSFALSFARRRIKATADRSPFCALRACIIDLASTFAPQSLRKLEVQCPGYGGQAVVTSSRVLQGTRS